MRYKDLVQKFNQGINRPFNPKVVAVFEKGRFPTIICNGKAVVELKDFEREICLLTGDEVFVLGRESDCNVDLVQHFGVDTVVNNVSRYHCFIERQIVPTGEAMYVLYDCSSTDTSVVLTKTIWLW